MPPTVNETWKPRRAQALLRPDRRLIASLFAVLTIAVVTIPLSFSAIDDVYSNPRSYRIRYIATFVNVNSRMDRVQIYLPIPIDWPSQKNVHIERIEPTPESINEESTYGNKMAYFKVYSVPSGSSLNFTIQYTFTFYETHFTIDPTKVGSYDTKDPEYVKYTAHRPADGVESDDPLIFGAASEIVGSEKNPYLKAKLIYDWIVKNIRYEFPSPWGAKETYIKRSGDCGKYTALFCAMCIAQGIPARAVSGLFFPGPYPRTYSNKGHPTDPGAYGCHVYAECYMPNYGWLPVDGSIGRSSGNPIFYFGQTNYPFLINSKGFGVSMVPPVGKVTFFQHYAWWFWGEATSYDSYYTYTVEETTVTRTLTVTTTKTSLVSSVSTLTTTMIAAGREILYAIGGALSAAVIIGVGYAIQRGRRVPRDQTSH